MQGAEPNRTPIVRLSSIGFFFDFVRLDTPGIWDSVCGYLSQPTENETPSNKPSSRQIPIILVIRELQYILGQLARNSSYPDSRDNEESYNTRVAVVKG